MSVCEKVRLEIIYCNLQQVRCRIGVMFLSVSWSQARLFPLLSIMFSPLTVPCVTCPTAATVENQIHPVSVTCLCIKFCVSLPVLLLFPYIIEQFTVMNEFVGRVLR